MGVKKNYAAPVGRGLRRAQSSRSARAAERDVIKGKAAWTLGVPLPFVLVLLLVLENAAFSRQGPGSLFGTEVPQIEHEHVD